MPKFKAGDRLGRHEIVRFIDAGGMGEVYEARHVDLKKRVALKCLIENVDGFQEIRRRFLQEGEAASRIQHPNVVAVFDVGVEGDVVYMVMEFLEGIDLQERLTAHGALSGPELVELMLPVCAAVAAAHDAGVIHRDLKPANVFLARNPLGGADVPKILDFGISKLTRDPNHAVTLGTAILGTPEFLSPEQALGRSGIDAKVDQYALGVMMYQCLGGRLPYSGASVYLLMTAIVKGEATPIDRLVPGLDPALTAAVTRAMSLERADRFRTVRHLGAALLPLASPMMRETWAASFQVAPHEPGEDGADAAQPPQPSTPVGPPEARALAEPAVPGRTVDQLVPHKTGGLDLPTAPPRTGATLAGVAALLTAAALGIYAWRDRGSRVEPIAEPSPASAGAATPAPGRAPEPAMPIAAGPEAAAAATDGGLVDVPASAAAPVTPTPTPPPTRAAAPSTKPTPSSVTVKPEVATEASPTPSPSTSRGANEAPILR